jgi:hypothetical protein
MKKAPVIKSSKRLLNNNRSGTSKIGCGVLHDHGSTEVTTIESYELHSALEIHHNSTSSKDVDQDPKSTTRAGGRLKNRII